MSHNRPMTVVEIDIDQCTLVYGVGSCPAALDISNQHKCYNAWATCQAYSAFNKGVNTLRFCEDTYRINGQNYIPCLRSVGGYEQEVNISGYMDTLAGLGKRAHVNVEMMDFTDRGTLTDKYWSERISGAAQYSGVGYDPINSGTFWAKFKAQNPNYSGRPLRVIRGYVDDDGDFVAEETRAYVMTDFKGPNNGGNVTIVAKDILDLADNKKAQAPKVSFGRLLADMTNSQTNLTLNPAGSGDGYPASGYITIGSEIMSFTRSGDDMTVVRGLLGTQAATHSTNDSVQVAYHCNTERADSVIYDLLVNYAGIDPAYIDFAEWQAEFNTWGPAYVLSTTICKPTGIVQLLGEICVLGMTIWWDEVNQKIRLQLNHPPMVTPAVLNDRNNLISIKQEDNEDERASRVILWTVQLDPTKEKQEGNFERSFVAVSADEELPFAYDGVRSHIIYNRWLNHGSGALVNIIAGRILNRYKRAPVSYTVEVDRKDNIHLADVVVLESQMVVDANGVPLKRLTQVYYRKTNDEKATITLGLQRFQFDWYYGSITENTRPDYNSSTDQQKTKGVYFAGPSLKFSDGRDAYRFV